MSFRVQGAPDSKAALWTGRVISTLVVLCLLFDGITKVIKEHHAMDASAKLGYPADTVVGVGSMLLVWVPAFRSPRTSFRGATLLTGYVGGAVASHFRVHDPVFDT